MPHHGYTAGLHDDHTADDPAAEIGRCRVWLPQSTVPAGVGDPTGCLTPGVEVTAEETPVSFPVCRRLNR